MKDHPNLNMMQNKYCILRCDITIGDDAFTLTTFLFALAMFLNRSNIVGSQHNICVAHECHWMNWLANVGQGLRNLTWGLASKGPPLV